MATEAGRHTTRLVAVPRHPDAFEGPVLAADTGGVWLIGVDQRRRSFLTRVFSGPRAKREYTLEDEPRAVAVGYRLVWVVTRGARSNHVLGIDPATGEVTKRTNFPSSSPIDGLTVGLGNVWVVASSTGRLYRIDPRSARVTGRLDLLGHAARPVVVLGAIWVGLSDSGGGTVTVDPRTLNASHLDCCPRSGATSWPGTDRSGRTTFRPGTSCGGAVRPMTATPSSISPIRRSTRGCA